MPAYLVSIGTQPSLIPVARFMSKFVSNPMDSLIGLVSNIRAKRTEEIESGKSARPDML